ncbi:MAG: hypothetical protein COT16_00540 [Elusimicrobia bacterium CG08_land_8_20_14_0_20_44_26]|nr:MAG: hypothetical protein COT16_00540 [Elusimicrobia bacterium CG08_land_8_20_14_0_20_44_26]
MGNFRKIGKLINSVPIFFLCLIVICFGCAASNKNNKIRKSVYKGSWYPASAAEISAFLQGYIEKSSSTAVNGTVLGVIVPHAGWVYAAPVGAYITGLIKGMDISEIVLVGPSHKIGFAGVAVGDYDGWETPYGIVPEDKKIASLVCGIESASFNNAPHTEEHSLEVILPYFQAALSGFSIVPVITGQDYESWRPLGEKLASLYREGMLFAASSDMSHYFTYEDANKMDGACLEYIENFNIEGLESALRKNEVQLCGDRAVLAVMKASRLAGADSVKILKYANSGDTSGNKSRVVGYGAVCFYKKEVEVLDDNEKKELLKIARKTIDFYIRQDKVPDFDIQSDRLKEIQGAFVTLNMDERLRGCIGNIVGSKPLWETVRAMAIESSTRDPRFPPVTKDELSKIKIEISVLSPLKKARPEDIVLGRDGVIIKKGFKQGVYLPQVATETGWSKEEFLDSLCMHKAGLPKDAWKDEDTEIYIFQATVFSEKDYRK